MKHVRQNGKTNCGQIAVACLTGKPVEEIEALVGHAHGSKTRELAKVLRALGYSCLSRCVPHFRFAKPPAFGLAQMRDEKRKSGWHWVAIGEGFVWDGALKSPVAASKYEAVISEYPFLPRGRITSYLPVTRS